MQHVLASYTLRGWDHRPMQLLPVSETHAYINHALTTVKSPTLCLNNACMLCGEIV
jgi:hypothetical protein